jgi:antitoxin HicB
MEVNAMNLSDYLKLPWSFQFEYDSRDNLYVASVTELKGCMSHGKTIVEAAQNIQEALECYLESMIKDGDEIPVPTPK